MKTEKVETAPPKLTRTVKISDDMHHELRVIAVSKRMPMQELVEKVLRAGLKKKGFATSA